ncbi:NAD(P)/FAD-dependent oxidoreductase [Paenibacillus alkalitolerans]|uniref:NAD(P)/FAD-dependent oxidoreductase n=1 Tax=Paenibacillus alkalitolerans TaxID=2799335 RepID=UPI0018F61A44|nr:FAD-dependent oxidoreductase [Paenibacillus alkalitolerans]
MTDVVIIGAGPAGLAAAIVCADHGCKVKVIDEFMKPGGRLLGQLHQEKDGKWWNGMAEGDELTGRAVRAGVQIELGVSVYDLQRSEPGWIVHTSKEVIAARSVVLATGASELPVSLPGWTLPGVMTVGAAQVMANVHRVKPGSKGIIIGINILSFAIARELQLCGIELSAMVLAPNRILHPESASPHRVMDTLAGAAHMAPSSWMRIGGNLLKSSFLKKTAVRFYPKRGVTVWGIPVQLRKAAVEIVGDRQVSGVRVADVNPEGEVLPGSVRELAADFVCVSGGLYPLAELASVAGCPFRHVPELGGRVPLHSERMQTPLQGLYVAGNITGIESAKVAMAQGYVAGYSIMFDRTPEDLSVRDRLADAVASVRRIREEAPIQFHDRISEGRAAMERLWAEFQAENGAQ